jgi:hypothetical protein
VRMHPKITDFLQQRTTMPTTLAQGKAQLIDLCTAIDKEMRLIEQQTRQMVAAPAPKKK